MVMGVSDLPRAIQLIGLGLNFLYLSGPCGPIACLLPSLAGDISVQDSGQRLEPLGDSPSN